MFYGRARELQLQFTTSPHSNLFLGAGSFLTHSAVINKPGILRNEAPEVRTCIFGGVRETSLKNVSGACP